MVMSQSDVSALKDTLHAQQQLLQKLYSELDAEREASASAASEALSMILRLQGEKAAIKMEAEQYKRLAEEKMCHAEESFEIIQDIIYQKEMEVASLDYQVQAYRHKLLSMGCVEPGISDIKYPDTLLQRNEALSVSTTTVGPTSIGRRNSAPVLVKYKKLNIERESSTSPEMIAEEQQTDEDPERKTDNYSTSGVGINPYWEQIRKLDERVMEIAGANPANLKNGAYSSSSPFSRISAGNLSDSSNYSNLRNDSRSPSPQLDRVFLKNGASVDRPRSPNVYDVFEVPQIDESCVSHESMPSELKKTNVCKGGNKNFEKEVHPEAVKLYPKDEPDWLKKLLQMNHHCCYASGSESRVALNQINRTPELIEVERSTDKAEELKLLNDIKEQLNLLRDEINVQKMKKSYTCNDYSLCSISEAMLHFWL